MSKEEIYRRFVQTLLKGGGTLDLDNEQTKTTYSKLEPLTEEKDEQQIQQALRELEKVMKGL